MKFTIWKTDFEVRWIHIAIVALVTILFAIIFLGLDSLRFLLPWYIWQHLQNYVQTTSGFVGIIDLPVTAWICIEAGKWMKLKTDDEFSKSIAAAYPLIFWLIEIAIILGTVLYWPTSISDSSYLIRESELLIYALVSAVLLYLWLSLFTKYEKEKADEAIPLVVYFAFIIFLLTELFLFVSSYYSGSVYIFTPTNAKVITFLSNLLFGFVLIYNVKARRLDHWTYSFAGVLLLTTILTELSIGMNDGFQLIQFCYVVIEGFKLVLIFSLAKMKLPDDAEIKEKKSET